MEAEMILYTTAGCHLCEQAEDIVNAVLASREAGDWHLRKQDVAESEALMERYGLHIPVVRLPATSAELSWPFDEQRFRQFLQEAGA